MNTTIYDLYDKVKNIDHCNDNVISGISFLSNSDRVMVNFSMSPYPRTFDNMDQALSFINQWINKHDKKMHNTVTA